MSPEPTVDADALADLTARRVIDLLRARKWTLATAESLTAGLLASTLAEVPGCSDVLRGGVVAYQADIKSALLGVPMTEVEAGVVRQAVAEEMASGARTRLGADVGVATTGVAGPEPHAGEPVGSVWIAVASPSGVTSAHLSLTGDRRSIRRATVTASLDLLLAQLV